jgi:S-adenosylmethionine decarboxylase
MSTRRQIPTPKYLHLVVECRGCPSELIGHGPTIRKALRLAAKSCGLHVVQEGIHRFRPQGVTGYVLLRESHISVHTWPESGFALADILSCVAVDLETLTACFRQLWKPTGVIVRGLKGAQVQANT